MLQAEVTKKKKKEVKPGDDVPDWQCVSIFKFFILFMFMNYDLQSIANLKFLSPKNIL